MRYIDFITETTSQDKLIVKLANEINSLINKYEYNEKVIKQGLYLGKIEKISKIDNESDIAILNPVHIELVSDSYMNKIAPGKTGARALWDPNIKTVYLNTDYIGDPRMARLIAHELRHALDSYLSDFDSGKGYDIPRKKEYRYSGDPLKDPKRARTDYLARPSEINARFLEVLHLITPVIEHAVKTKKSDAFNYSFDKLKYYLKKKEILDLFPEGTESTDLRRLYNRGIDYITHKIEELQTAN
jgi:hypothetical protein